MLPPRASMTAWQRRLMLLTSLLKLFWGSSFHSSTTATHSSGRSRGCRAQAWRRLLSWSQPCSSGLRSEDSAGHSMWRSPTSWIRACTILARCGGASSPTKMKFGAYWRCCGIIMGFMISRRQDRPSHSYDNQISFSLGWHSAHAVTPPPPYQYLGTTLTGAFRSPLRPQRRWRLSFRWRVIRDSSVNNTDDHCCIF